MFILLCEFYAMVVKYLLVTNWRGEKGGGLINIDCQILHKESENT